MYIYIYIVKILKTNGSTESKTANFDFFNAFK